MATKTVKKSDAQAAKQAKKPVVVSGPKKNQPTKIKEIKEIKVAGRFVKVAPAKVRLVADRLRKKTIEQALDELQFMMKSSVSPLTKLLNSAIADAQHNFQYDKKDLFIKELTVNQGPTLKRFRPRAYGRSAMIRKRTSHIDLLIGIKEGAKQIVAKKKSDKADAKLEEVKVLAPQDVKKQIEGVGAADSGEQEKGQKKSGFLKKVFSRKTG